MVAVQRNVRVNSERWDKSQRAGEAVGRAIQIHLARFSAIYHRGLTFTHVVCAAYLGTQMRHSGKMASLFLLPTSQFYKLAFIYWHTVFLPETPRCVSTRRFFTEIEAGGRSCVYL